VGEAFDPLRANTSLYLTGASGRSLLLDCGFTAAAALLRHGPDPAALASGLCAVFLSHFHGDHYLGLPWLLVRLREEGRTVPLAVIGQAGVQERVWACLDLAYPSFRTRPGYALEFLEVGAGQAVEAAGFRLSFAAGDHSLPCLAVRVEEGGGPALFYSGDGRPTDATRALARGAALAVQEAATLAPGRPDHGSVAEALALAREAGVKALALVHLSRRISDGERAALAQRLAAEPGLRAWLPREGEAADVA
jgi:ribonuclease BN (tRNA processing enzyme)